jgi:hypothetical protein
MKYCMNAMPLEDTLSSYFLIHHPVMSVHTYEMGATQAHQSIQDTEKLYSDLCKACNFGWGHSFMECKLVT